MKDHGSPGGPGDPRGAESTETNDAVFLAAPAALVRLNDGMLVLAVNDAFLALCPAARVGVHLGELLPGPTDSARVPNEGAVRTWRTACAGRALDVTIRRSGGLVIGAVVERTEAVEGRVLLELGRKVGAATSEEPVVAALVEAARALFPGRPFGIRVVDPKTNALTSLWADGRLLPGVVDVLKVRRAAARKLGLATEQLPEGRVRVVEEDAPIFEGATHGRAVPLASSGQLLGQLDLDDTSPPVDPEADERRLITLANTASIGLRNAKLIEELTFVKQYLEDLLEQANALILVVNRDRRIIVFNRALATLSGHTREQVLGTDVLDHLPESERLKFVRVVALSLKGQAVNNLETKLLTADGQEKSIVLSTASVLAPGGEIEGVIAIGQDQSKIAALEQKVVHASRLAGLGQLAAGIVHEINNPLTAILVAGEGLRSRWQLDPAAGPELDRATKIVEAGQRIHRFTRDLVSYARPTADKLEAVQIEPVLLRAASFCEHELKQAQGRLVTRFSATPQVLVMRQNLEQVFVNLVTNACHALAPGGTVELLTRTEGGFVEIEVRDDGAGIEPRHLEKIFEPFFSTKADGRGTGLGLSIAVGIVEKLGGAIAVESAIGRGTTFRVRLPEAPSR